MLVNPAQFNPHPQLDHNDAAENDHEGRSTHTNSILEAGYAANDSGRTILNETIAPHNNVQNELYESQDPSLHLRPVDYTFAQHALPQLHVITPDYVKVSLKQAFNWNEVAELLGEDAEGDWFIVAFRSIRSVNADSKALYEADHKAHEEAKQSGGLLKYWYGDLNQHRECLAMCIWSNHAFAKLATRKPLHLQAVKLARYMYDTYELERYSLTKFRGERRFHITRL